MSKPRTDRLIAETLELMRLLASTVEYGECVLWTGALGSTGHPIYKPAGCNCTLVRRRIFELAGGELESRIPIATTCDERTCINPEHLEKTTSQAIAKRAGARGAWSGKVRAAKIAQSKRATGKLTMDKARAIRMSAESGPVLATRYGVDRSLINAIKTGKSWKDYSNPFAALMR